MGEPAIPTDAERNETCAYAKAIVDAVRNDELGPHPEYPESSPTADLMVFRMAQEIELLLAEIATLRERLSDRPRHGY